MKIKTTPSVVIRIFLWVIMLVGGIYYGIKYDIIYFPHLIADPFFHSKVVS